MVFKIFYEFIYSEADEVLWHVNTNLTDIVTPIDVDKLEELLIQSRYNKRKGDYLIEGFRYGFDICYQGDSKVKKTAPNLKLNVGSPTELWNKVMKEVGAGRYAGPFEDIPFEFYVQSPIGLVPKDRGKKTRLIFHLSYPKNGDSVNSEIPKDKCTVKYPSFDEAVKLCLSEGKCCSMGKSDMSMAFRNVPLKSSTWFLLVMKAKHPITGKCYYFVDKCLPFGSSASCAIFQAISDGIAYLVQFRTNKPTVNYLDD